MSISREIACQYYSENLLDQAVNQVAKESMLPHAQEARTRLENMALAGQLVVQDLEGQDGWDAGYCSYICNSRHARMHVDENTVETDFGPVVIKRTLTLYGPGITVFFIDQKIVLRERFGVGCSTNPNILEITRMSDGRLSSCSFNPYVGTLIYPFAELVGISFAKWLEQLDQPN